jgi:hypothetical protein
VTGEALVAASGESLPVAAPPREEKSQPEQTVSPAPAESPLTIPGPGSAPSTSPVVPAAPAGGSSGGGGASVPPGSTAGGAGHAGPLVPASPATAAPAGSATTPEGEGLTDATQSAAIEADDGDGGSPWIPIGIGLGVGAIALLAPWLLGRRYAW